MSAQGGCEKCKSPPSEAGNFTHNDMLTFPPSLLCLEDQTSSSFLVSLLFFVSGALELSHIVTLVDAYVA